MRQTLKMVVGSARLSLHEASATGVGRQKVGGTETNHFGLKMWLGNGEAYSVIHIQVHKLTQ